MRKKKNPQAQYRKQVFHFDQFWSVHFTEVYASGEQKDYRTVIKARSASFAKSILAKKIKDDNKDHKVKAIQLFMFVPDCVLNGLHITTEDWVHIRQSSFPNSANVLFKHFVPRPKGYTNRFNNRNGTHCTQFKKGAKNTFYVPPEEEKPFWKFEGKWKPWPKKERDNLKEQLILALSLNGNSRTLAAQHMGIGRRQLYKLMNKKFVEVDWDKEYPSSKPNIKYARVDNEKRLRNLKATKKRQSEEYIKNMYPKYKKLQQQGLLKTQIRRVLGCNTNIINKCIEYDKQR